MQTTFSIVISIFVTSQSLAARNTELSCSLWAAALFSVVLSYRLSQILIRAQLSKFDKVMADGFQNKSFLKNFQKTPVNRNL